MNNLHTEFSPATNKLLDELLNRWLEADNNAEYFSWVDESANRNEVAAAAAYDAAKRLAIADRHNEEMAQLMELADYDASMNDASYRKGY